jgi:hypothetical protein
MVAMVHNLDPNIALSCAQDNLGGSKKRLGPLEKPL